MRDEVDLHLRVKGLRGLGLGVRAISRCLEISPKLAWEHVREIDRGGARVKRHKENALERWVRSHSQVTLPRTGKEISALTGIPTTVVSACLRRRREKFSAWVSWLGPLESRTMILQASDGTKVSTGAVAKYEWVFSEPRNETRLEVVLVTGESFTIPVPDRFKFSIEWRKAPRRGD